MSKKNQTGGIYHEPYKNVYKNLTKPISPNSP